MTRLIFLRHGEVEERYQRHFGGRIDMDLSPHGHEQSAALAGFLHREKVDAVYASPMKRVQQTLAPFLANGTPRPIVLEDLREIDFGAWTGVIWKDALSGHGMESHQWLEALTQGIVRDAEPIPSYQIRVGNCLRQIVTAHPGQTVAIFCHGGVIRAILAEALGLPLVTTGAFAVDYASVTELEAHDDKRFVLRTMNFTPWRNGS